MLSCICPVAGTCEHCPCGSHHNGVHSLRCLTDEAYTHSHAWWCTCRWRRGMSAAACSPQPAGLPILTPTLLPLVCQSPHVTASPLLLVHLHCHSIGLRSLAWHSSLTWRCVLQLLECVTCLAKALSITCVWFKLEYTYMASCQVQNTSLTCCICRPQWP